MKGLISYHVRRCEGIWRGGGGEEEVEEEEREVISVISLRGYQAQQYSLISLFVANQKQKKITN